MGVKVTTVTTSEILAETVPDHFKFLNRVQTAWTPQLLRIPIIFGKSTRQCRSAEVSKSPIQCCISCLVLILRGLHKHKVIKEDPIYNSSKRHLLSSMVG